MVKTELTMENKQKKQAKPVELTPYKSEITHDRIFDLLDCRFSKKNIMYEHLHKSYNDCIYQIITYLQTNSNVFNENKVGDKIYRYRLKYENIVVRPALNKDGDTLMYPMDARDKDLTYSLKIIATVTQVQEIYDLNKKEIISVKTVGEVFEKETAAIIPNMVGSQYCSTIINKEYKNRECKLDPGGYFIVSGLEKILLCIEKVADNKPLVYVKRDVNVLNYHVQMNSRSTNVNTMMQTIKIKLKKNYDILITVPILKEVSVFVLMRALGMDNDKEIIKYVVYNENDIDMVNVLKIALNLSKKDGKKIVLSREDAIYCLSTKIKTVKTYVDKDKDKKLQQTEKREYLEYLLLSKLMPHIDNTKYSDPLKTKAIMLGYMVNKLLNCFLGRVEQDDRDSFVNKRVEMPGDIIFELFKQFYKKMLNDGDKFFKKRSGGSHDAPLNIIGQLKPASIEQGIKSTLMTGNCGKRKGVAQIFPRLTYLQSIVFLRRIDVPTTDQSTCKLTGPRHYHPSQVGMICCVDSPEHANIGLVKHLSVMGSITIGSKDQMNLIYSMIKSLSKFVHMNNHTLLDIEKCTKIFLNGEWIGFTMDPMEVYTELRELKLNNLISRTNSIIHDVYKNEIKIYTETGRLYRNLLNVKNNKIVLTNDMVDDVLKSKSNQNYNKWDYLIMKYPEAIDTIDVEEQYYSMISRTIDEVVSMKINEDKPIDTTIPKVNLNRYDDSKIIHYSHCEFHPSMLLGVISGNIPFSNHNPGTRNIFQYAQGKQAMGWYTTNYRDRLDISYILYNTQKPIANTRISKYTHCDVLPCGENAIVMIGCYTGHNQEDSLIFNQSSIDRGLFRSTSLKKWKSSISKNQSTSQEDIFMKPDTTKLAGKKYADYEKLNEKGFVPEETFIKNNDIIIGKVTPVQATAGSSYTLKDSSEIYKSHEPAIIDKVFHGIVDQDGYEMIKTRTRSERVPKIGDKFCCYTSDHEVLTENGWKFINEIGLKDKVATLYNSHTLKYSYPTQIQEFDYDGKLYKVETEGIDLITTPNHRMYVKKERDGFNFNIELAEDIYSKYRIYKKNIEIFKTDDVMATFSLSGTDSLPELVIDMELWLTFYGTWIGYGRIEETGIIIPIENNNVKQNILYVCVILNISHHILDSTLIIDDERFVNYIMGTNDTKFPQWIWKLTTSQCTKLLTMITTKTICTKNIDYANDLQKLYFHSGYSATVVKHDHDHDHKYKVVRSQSFEGVNYAKQQDEYIDFTYLNCIKNKVYCCSVAGEGIIYVRRGGKSVWCGNTRHGQKGTIGLTLSQSDMPFTKDGISPDIIINPHAFPSRMSTGQLIEGLTSKIGAIVGNEVDGTPFMPIAIEKIKDKLESLGYERNGTEYMYNGMTGQRIKSSIFIGPTFYQRLKHLAMDKIHSRARGQTTMLTRQPPEGRSKDGGLKCGEMERDSIITHGASIFLLERMLHLSDLYSMYVCAECGGSAQRIVKKENKSHPQSTDVYKCVLCKNNPKTVKIILPYAMKLLMQELGAMGILLKVRTTNYTLN